VKAALTGFNGESRGVRSMRNARDTARDGFYRSRERFVLGRAREFGRWMRLAAHAIEVNRG